MNALRATFLLLALSFGARADDALDARADALRTELAASPPSETALLKRQLLASLERRRDLARARGDVERMVAQPLPDVAAPRGLLEADDARRELVQLDESIENGTRRIEILQADRAAGAAQLAGYVAALRQLDERTVPFASAKLQAELAESATGELDGLIAVIGLQQRMYERQRAALAARLARVPELLQPTAAERRTIADRLAQRGAALQARLAAAAAERERVAGELGTAPSETLRERLANADIDTELAREALSNLAVEQTAWDLALRWLADRDPEALVDARARGPAVRERLARRRELLAALAEQLLGRIALLEAQIGQSAAATERAERTALRDVFDRRLRMVQAGMLDEQQLGQLLERMRADFDRRLAGSALRERAVLAWAQLRALAARAWDFELFTIDQPIELDGRRTSVARGVTVGNLVKAPLLLVLGMLLAIKLCGWAERRARRRGVDEAFARLVKRWVLGLVACACVLASLVLAGIPLAAFAFIGGAAAIGLGFGMQNLLKNLLSGLLVLIERPFRLGDVIEVGALRGTVVDIDLRASVVRDGDGSETLIPNSALVEQSVKNVTYRSRDSRQSVQVTVEHGADARVVMEAIRDAALRHGKLLDSRDPTVFLDDILENGLRFTLHYWIDLGGADRKRIASDLRLMILNALADTGVALARPLDAPARLAA